MGRSVWLLLFFVCFLVYLFSLRWVGWFVVVVVYGCFCLLYLLLLFMVVLVIFVTVSDVFTVVAGVFVIEVVDMVVASGDFLNDLWCVYDVFIWIILRSHRSASRWSCKE